MGDNWGFWVIADYSVLCKKQSFALLETLVELSGRMAQERLRFGGFALCCVGRGGSLGGWWWWHQGWRDGAAPLVATRTRGDMVPSGTSPSAS